MAELKHYFKIHNLKNNNPKIMIKVPKCVLNHELPHYVILVGCGIKFDAVHINQLKWHI